MADIFIREDTFLTTLNENDDYTITDPTVTLTIANPLPVNFHGRIRGAGSLSKTGAGTLTLTGASDTTGTLYVRSGTVVVGTPQTNGVIWHGDVEVNRTTGLPEAILAGDGIINGNVDIVNSIISSGNDIGTLTIFGNLHLDGRSKIISHFNPTTVDRLTVHGNMTLEGCALEMVAASGTYSVSDNVILDGSPGTSNQLLGGFGSVTLINPNNIGALNYSVTYNRVDKQAHFALTVTRPELFPSNSKVNMIEGIRLNNPRKYRIRLDISDSLFAKIIPGDTGVIQLTPRGEISGIIEVVEYVREEKWINIFSIKEIPYAIQFNDGVTISIPALADRVNIDNVGGYIGRDGIDGLTGAVGPKGDQGTYENISRLTSDIVAFRSGDGNTSKNINSTITTSINTAQYTFTRPLANANYIVLAQDAGTSTTTPNNLLVTNKSVNGFSVEFFTASGLAGTPRTNIEVVVIGDVNTGRFDANLPGIGDVFKPTSPNEIYDGIYRVAIDMSAIDMTNTILAQQVREINFLVANNSDLLATEPFIYVDGRDTEGGGTTSIFTPTSTGITSFIRGSGIETERGSGPFYGSNVADQNGILTFNVEISGMAQRVKLYNLLHGFWNLEYYPGTSGGVQRLRTRNISSDNNWLIRS